MKENNEIRRMELATRQLEATIHLVEYFYGLLMQYKNAGIHLTGIAYTLDLLCGHLMTYYGGDKEIIKSIQEQAKKEINQYYRTTPALAENDLEKATRELKDLGINFKVVYDPVTKKAYPNVDVSKYVTPDMFEEYMNKNMDKVLDYINKKKQEKEQKDKENETKS